MTSERAPTPAALGSVASHVVMIWARVTEQVWRNGLRLWQVPVELAAAEDASLGVWTTSVYFAAPATTNVRLHCASVKEVPSGRVCSVRVTPKPTEYVAAEAAQKVQIALPRRLGAGLYEITLEDDTTGACQSYQLPFGVPGRRR